MNNNRSALHQQHRIQHYAATSDVFSFFNQLTSPDLLDTLESSLPEHRERLFLPTETLSMFLAQAMQADHSCQRQISLNMKQHTSINHIVMINLIMT